MCALDHKKCWAPTNWCFRTVVLEKTLESPLDNKDIKTVNPKRNQPWIFIGRTDAETEAPILWPPDLKIQITGKDPGAGKDWGQQEKGRTEDEMVDGFIYSVDMSLSKLQETVKEKGNLACCRSWGSQRVRHILGLDNNKYKHNIITVVFSISDLYRVLYEYAYCYTSVFPD